MTIGSKFAISGLLAGLLLFSSCGAGSPERAAAADTGGNHSHGKELISRYGCPSCHTIPGVHGADGLVGPPLTRIASRVYVAGMLPNTPGNMERWIRNPKEVNHLTAMPYLAVTPSDARDITGYLYTLK